MILITGGAGFIGSNLVASLNGRGRDDIIVYDLMLHEGQWKNLVKRRGARVIADANTLQSIPPVTAVVHLAAWTDTMEICNARAVMINNYTQSIQWLDWAGRVGVPFIYASSAATYGDGSAGFSDDLQNLDNLRPLSLYAWSKHLFDQYVAREQLASQVVGLKFFNVYGPNEYHKGKMASLVCQNYGRNTTDQPINLFGPHDSIKRDFVYVEDAAAVILWMLDHPEVSGIFNVGTGQARTFEAFIYYAMNQETMFVDSVETPAALRPAYQRYTQADLTNLRKVGCDVPFRPIEEGVKHYVEKYLSQPDRYR